MSTNTDRIEKQIVLKAPRSKVWRALTDHEQFSTWFRFALEGPFVAGKTTRGRVTHAGFENVPVEMMIERIEPERFFSYRWHPYAIDPKVDYSSEPTTLIEFTLEEHGGGTLLKVVESGFDRIPAHRRDEAIRMNTGGWEAQLRNIADYLGEKAA
jgi:uncharacterized protein YndB with AHSA1/START domain